MGLFADFEFHLLDRYTATVLLVAAVVALAALTIAIERLVSPRARTVCTACGRHAELGDKYCGDCGTILPAQ